MVKLYQSEAWLKNKYVAEGKTIQQIADECGTSHQTIYRYLKKFDLIRDPRSWS